MVSPPSLGFLKVHFYSFSSGILFTVCFPQNVCVFRCVWVYTTSNIYQICLISYICERLGSLILQKIDLPRSLCVSGTQWQGSIKSNLLSDTRSLGPHVSSIFSLTLEGMVNQPFTSSLLVIISLLFLRLTWQNPWSGHQRWLPSCSLYIPCSTCPCLTHTFLTWLSLSVIKSSQEIPMYLPPAPDSDCSNL